MDSVREVNIKSWAYFFFDGMINIKNIDPSKIKINEKLYKNIFIYHIGYVTIKDFRHLKIKSVNPLYLIISKINGYIEERNGKHI